MIVWLTENMGNIVITLVLVLLVVRVILSMIRDKKRGKSTCGGCCAHCQMCAACHTEKVGSVKQKSR